MSAIDPSQPDETGLAEAVVEMLEMGQKRPVRALFTTIAGTGLLLCTFCACQSESVPIVHVNLGTLPEERRSFTPKSALAEYVELPSAGAELRILLSSHAMSCEVPPKLEDDQTLVSLTFSVPPGRKLDKGTYVWTPPEAAAADGTSTTPAEPWVMPYVRLGKSGRAIPPGGQAEITEMVMEPDGFVRGLLRLEQPGAGGKPATSILGSFSARWCRLAFATSADSP